MAQPGYLNDSSSTDTDEDWEQDAQIFAHLVQQANASSSIRRSKAPNIDRGRVEANARLMADYFDDNPTYPEKTFKRRFRMSRNLFIRIVYDLYTRYPYFQQQYDATGLPGLSPYQKCTAAIRQLAYGITGDAWDDYVRMGESTARKCLNHFVEGIIQMYGKVYLRKPTYEDIQQLYAAHDDRHGFPGMLGSLDCMHWEWAMCPVAWQGQYHRGDKPHPSIILEAAASQDTWIWHAFFGCPGAMNDLNVLNHSPIFEDVYNGIAPDRTFQVNGATYKHGYYLGDGIYHEWATFVKAFSYPEDDKRIKFKGAQEAARKDIERAFGILRKRWNIIKQPSRFMEIPTMRKVMYACIILHNMILENKNEAICVVPNDIPDPPNPQLTEEQPSVSEARTRNETHIQFYMHDTPGGPNASAVRVAGQPINATDPNNTGAPMFGFGSIYVMDNALTATPEINSTLIGRAQGIYAMASQEDPLSLHMTLTYNFVSGIYNGSSLSVVGRNPVMNEVREMPVVGGTRVFRLARGFALAKTHSMNQWDAIIGYNAEALTQPRKYWKSPKKFGLKKFTWVCPDYILGNFYRELKHAPLGLTLSGSWLLTHGFELGWVFSQHQALTDRLPFWEYKGTHLKCDGFALTMVSLPKEPSTYKSTKWTWKASHSNIPSLRSIKNMVSSYEDTSRYPLLKIHPDGTPIWKLHISEYLPFGDTYGYPSFGDTSGYPFRR
ncbi:hypothetical protein OSB04_005283 [Centaurea solstitialis]|uniref:Harbinger transposase-derived protein n=1 Tax=Centaurea solstitialis TaxID=347529 RepID=A0AA38U0D3_9ASTR|nr:hypothetical protein OSB04_005283 [Centaurea solstitialis]